MKKVTMFVVVVAFVILALLAGRFYLTQQDLGLSNPYWDGLSQLGGDARPLYDMNALAGLGENDTLLVISPTSNFTALESSSVSSFMGRGGSVVVMDDYGDSNSLLEVIDSPIQLNQVPLCQDVDFYLRPSFPVIKNIEPSDLTRNVSSLVCDHPVSLNVTGNVSVIASTSDLGWLDYNDNGLMDKDEPSGSYTVAAEVSYGRGMLTVIGDPDILINSMQDRGDNKVLASNILSSGTVYVDAAHGQSIPFLAQAYYLIKYDLIAQFICVLAIVLLAFIYYRRNDVVNILYKHKETSEEPVDAKAVIIESMMKTPLRKEQIEELKRKL